MKACASEATLKADSEILVKGKLALDQTVLPPLLRIFAATCLPALTTALSDVAKQVEGAVVVASEEGSVKTAERMVEAMKSEIAKKHQAEEGAGLCVNQPVRRVHRQFFTKSFLGDEVAVLTRSSGEEPASSRHRAGGRVDGVEDDSAIQQNAT